MVVLTAEGQDSEWVAREIELAKLRNKPILPLRFHGKPLAQLADVQYEDISSGAMPTGAFITKLRALLTPRPTRSMSRRQLVLAITGTTAGATAGMLGAINDFFGSELGTVGWVVFGISAAVALFVSFVALARRPDPEETGLDRDKA